MMGLFRSYGERAHDGPERISKEEAKDRALEILDLKGRSGYRIEKTQDRGGYRHNIVIQRKRIPPHCP